MRVRCDRGVQERPCEGAVRPRQPCASVPPSHFENFRQAWQKCVAKFGNVRSTSAVRWFLEEDDGEVESAKSEMMVASSVLL